MQAAPSFKENTAVQQGWHARVVIGWTNSRTCKLCQLWKNNLSKPQASFNSSSNYRYIVLLPTAELQQANPDGPQTSRFTPATKKNKFLLQVEAVMQCRTTAVQQPAFCTLPVCV